MFPSWPSDVMLDEHSVVVDIYTVTEGGEDEWGNPLPPKRTYYVQDAPADVQPKSGAQRAAQSGTTFEATHTLFLDGGDAIPAGATVDVKDAVGGNVVQSYTVVYPANWGTHWQLDLKAVTT